MQRDQQGALEIPASWERILRRGATHIGIDLMPLPEMGSNEHLPWHCFAEWLDQLDGQQLQSARDWQRLGVAMACPSSPSLLLRWFVSPTAFYRLVVQHIFPRVAPHLYAAVSDANSESLNIRVHLRDSPHDCQPFFWLNAGQFVGLAGFLGHQLSSVRTEVNETGALYQITLPPSGTILSKLKNLWRILFSSRSMAARALIDQQKQVLHSYSQVNALQHDFESVLESSPIGLLVHDRGTMIYANAALAKALSVDSTTMLIGREFGEWLAHESQAIWQSQLDHHSESSPRHPVHVCVDSGTDTPVYLQLVVGPKIQFEGRSGQLITAEDITERRAMEKRMMDRTDTERQRFAFDLHDGMGQLLAGIAFQAHALEDMLQEKGSLASPPAKKLVSLANEAISRSRALARGINPVSEFEGGFNEALRALAHLTNEIYGHKLTCTESIVSFDQPLSLTTETQLYRIAQEAVNNALRHASATTITIALHVNESLPELEMMIGDNGIGFNVLEAQHVPENGPPTMGLMIMRYRAESIGADLQVQSSASHDSPSGTKVICTLPFSS